MYLVNVTSNPSGLWKKTTTVQTMREAAAFAWERGGLYEIINLTTGAVVTNIPREDTAWLEWSQAHGASPEVAYFLGASIFIDPPPPRGGKPYLS